jgi:hypothetical protein
MGIVDSKSCALFIDIYYHIVKWLIIAQHMTAPSVLWLMKLAFQELCMLKFMSLSYLVF